MIDHQIDEEMIFRDEVSDEVVEAAAAFVALGGLPTLMYRTYCFTCPSDLHTACLGPVDQTSPAERLDL